MTSTNTLTAPHHAWPPGWRHVSSSHPAQSAHHKAKRFAQQVVKQRRFQLHSMESREAWELEFLAMGLPILAARTAAASQSSILGSEVDGAALRFKQVSDLLQNHAEMTQTEVVGMVIRCPMNAASSPCKVQESLVWLRDTAGFTPQEIKVLVRTHLYSIQCSPSLLGLNWGLYRDAGLDSRETRPLWLESPWVLSHDLKSKLCHLDLLFGLSHRSVLLYNIGLLVASIKTSKVRFGMLRHWGLEDVCASRVITPTTHLEFADHEIGLQVQRSGKPMSFLCHELQQQPGMSSILPKVKMEPDTMTALQYYTLFSKWYLACERAQSKGR